MNTEETKWSPSNSTMGNIENSAIFTVAELSLSDRRAALRELNALFNKLRRGPDPKADETPAIEDFF